MDRNYQDIINDRARELAWDLVDSEAGQFATRQDQATRLWEMQNLLNSHKCDGWILGEPVHFTIDGPGFPGKRAIGILRDLNLKAGTVTLDYFGETIVQPYSSALGGISGVFGEQVKSWMEERERRGLPPWVDLFTRHGYS